MAQLPGRSHWMFKVIKVFINGFPSAFCSDMRGWHGMACIYFVAAPPWYSMFTYVYYDHFVKLSSSTKSRPARSNTVVSTCFLPFQLGLGETSPWTEASDDPKRRVFRQVCQDEETLLAQKDSEQHGTQCRRQFFLHSNLVIWVVAQIPTNIIIYHADPCSILWIMYRFCWLFLRTYLENRIWRISGYRLFSRKIMRGVAAATCQPRNNNALWLTH